MTRVELAALATATAAEREAADVGLIVVDTTGTIKSYNRWESEFAHLRAERVIGKNLFTRVAPCTAGNRFEGRMRTFAASEAHISAGFDYFFPFAHGNYDVRVTFVRDAAPDTIIIVIERRNAAPVPAIITLP